MLDSKKTLRWGSVISVILGLGLLLVLTPAQAEKWRDRGDAIGYAYGHDRYDRYDRYDRRHRHRPHRHHRFKPSRDYYYGDYYGYGNHWRHRRPWRGYRHYRGHRRWHGHHYRPGRIIRHRPGVTIIFSR